MKLAPEVFNIYQLAHELKMKVSDILTMPVAEIRGWFAYFEIIAERRK